MSVKPNPSRIVGIQNSINRAHGFKSARLCLGILGGFIASDLAATAADWQLTFGQKLADYQTTMQTLTNQGFRPVCLDVDGVGTAASYAVVWLNDGLTNWLAETELTAVQFSNRISQLSLQDYRVLCLDSYGSYPSERYAAVWVQDGALVQCGVQLRNLNSSEYESWTTNGYAPIWWDVNNSSGLWFANLYRKGNGWFAIWYGMTEDDLRLKFRDYSVWGWHLGGAQPRRRVRGRLGGQVLAGD